MNSDPYSGRRLGAFQIGERLGEGGMGAVYRAEHITLAREAAFKVLPDRLLKKHPAFAARFFSEARAAAKIDHPNVVKIYDAGEEEGVPYIAMEFIRGEDLRDKLNARAPFPEKEAVEVILQAALGLEAAAREGVVHRDIKPANLVLTEDGVVKVTDFGLARDFTVETHITQAGEVLGTPSFMSPEQADGLTADFRSDIYSLGVVFFELVTGVLPFWADSGFAVLRMQVEAPLPDPASLNSRLDPVVIPIIRRMMAKRPEDRYGSYDDLLKDLEKVHTALGGEEGVATTLLGARAKNRSLEEAPEDSEYPPFYFGPAELDPGGEGRSASIPAPSTLPKLIMLLAFALGAPLFAVILVALGVFSGRESPPPEPKPPMPRSAVKRPRLPSGLAGMFILPPGDQDQHGNPVARHAVSRDDLPVEIWLDSPRMEFVRLPAGRFTQGSPGTEPGRGETEGPLRTVFMKNPVYMGKYEVTQAQWQAVMGVNRSHHRGEEYPVELVTWSESRRFTEKLTDLKRGPCKFRLPSESEWEYAARAGTVTAYSTGPVPDEVLKAAWTEENSAGRAHPVGGRIPNAWSVYDLHGNLWEWCADHFHRSYKDAPRDGRVWKGSDAARVIRGGSWKNGADRARSAARGAGHYTSRGSHIGFRVVLVLEQNLSQKYR